MTRPEIIVALDVPSSTEMKPVLARLPAELNWFKVGLEVFCAEGPGVLAPLRERGCHVFLDLKLHDIPRTVERAVRSASRHGVSLLTVHACGGRPMLEAAAKAAKDAGPDRPRLLAVTVLTSMDQRDLSDVGVTRPVSDQVKALADLAISAGIDGLVCSPQEVGELRKRLGPGALLVTPGIRLPGGELGDQKRVATPGSAARDGATHLVIGRPILEAPDPGAAVRAIRDDIANALK
jgi:orotidine-5'-phosphate decarboxylase